MHRLWVTGRGLRAGGLGSEEIGRVTKRKGQARKNKSKGTARKVSDRTRNHEPPRPGDCDCQLEPKELAVEMTAAVTVRTPMCTGPQMRPTQSADGSVAERILERSPSKFSAIVDTRRPSDGRHI